MICMQGVEILLKPKDLIKKLTQNGWKVDRIQGSHYILEKNSETVSIPFHNKDMKTGLLHNILKKAELR